MAIIRDIILWLLGSAALASMALGFFPDFFMQLIARIYPADDPRRRERIAELYKIPRRDRFWWVGCQLSQALFDGLGARRRERATRRAARLIRRLWRNPLELIKERDAQTLALMAEVQKQQRDIQRLTQRISAVSRPESDDLYAPPGRRTRSLSGSEALEGPQGESRGMLNLTAVNHSARP